MRDRGTGSLYKRPGSKFYQIKFSKDGRVYRESTGTDKITVAKAILQQKLNQLEQGTYSAEAKKVRVSELMDAVLRDYEVNGRKSLDDAKARWKLHLEPVFGDAVAAHVTSDNIEQYKQRRIAARASNATINRELALLKRAFHLGMRATPPKVQRVPHIEMLKEHNVRTGFLERAEYERLAVATGKRGLWMRALLELGYCLGWRISELLGLRVKQVDLLNREIRLDPLTTKNREGRTAVLPDSAYQLLIGCIVGKQPDDYVFTRNGQRIRDFRGTWEAACSEAQVPGLLFHDLRRTAVRNMVRSGISENVAMRISGHKTRAVFDRYDIVSSSDLREAARKLELARDVPATQAQPVSTQLSTHFAIVDSTQTAN